MFGSFGSEMTSPFGLGAGGVTSPRLGSSPGGGGGGPLSGTSPRAGATAGAAAGPPSPALSPPPPPAAARPSAYYQIALHATGNVFSLLIGLVLWKLWAVLSMFQEPLLWAWLVSIALKDFKQFLARRFAFHPSNPLSSS